MDFADRFPVINGDTEPIPPFGIMEVNGVQTSTGAFTVTRPSEDGLTNVLFNGSTAIAVGALGSAHMRFPCVVAYVTDDYTGDDPVEGEIWGTAANSWYLTRAKAGFQILGGASSGRANIIPMPATWTQFVKLTSTTIDATSGCYPATRYIRDVEAKTWTSAGTVWFFDPVTPTNATTGMYIPSFYLGVFNAQEVWGAATWSSGGGGGGINKVSGPGGTFTPVDWLEFSSSNPWSISASGTHVTVTMTAAALGVEGYITNSDQYLGGGTKTAAKYQTPYVYVKPPSAVSATPPLIVLEDRAATTPSLTIEQNAAGDDRWKIVAVNSVAAAYGLIDFDSSGGTDTVTISCAADMKIAGSGIYHNSYLGATATANTGLTFGDGLYTGITGTVAEGDIFVYAGAAAWGIIPNPVAAGKVLLSSGTGLIPVWTTAPWGTGTVTTFSAGNLSPLFTVSVATATTTPALTFSLTNAAANTIFGNNSGSTGAPAYNAATTYSDAILNVSSTGFVKRTGANTYTIDNTSYGTGTVTSVSVVTANGVSGSVANATTTPSITLTLGAITPSSVNSLTITTSTGTLTIVNLKTFTVNNTLTLSGTDGSTLNIGGGGTLGTAAYTASTAYISSTLMTTLGDIIYEDATPTPARLAGNTTTTKKFLTQTGTGTISAVPGWNTIVGGDLPNSGVSAATYYLANPTFDATGRATACTNASVISLRDEETSGTDGGTATSGAWRTRTLNTKVGDANSNCTLASNQFTLTAGTYVIWASAPAFNVNRHQIRLRNTTDSTTICSGSSEYNSSNQTRSIIDGYVFTIAASKALEIQHQVAVTSNTNGFGVASGGFFTVANEVYTQVTLIRIG